MNRCKPKNLPLSDIVLKNSSVVMDTCALIVYENELMLRKDFDHSLDYHILKSSIRELAKRPNAQFIRFIHNNMKVIDNNQLMEEDGMYAEYVEEVKEVGYKTHKHVEGLAALMQLGGILPSDVEHLNGAEIAELKNRELEADYDLRAMENGFKNTEKYIRTRLLCSEEDMKLVAYALWHADPYGKNKPITILSEDSHVKQVAAKLKHEPEHGYDEVMTRVRVPNYTRRI